ncbi:unnamed protein product [Diabrotica balteata]|uniref:Tudor domain-containing protein n=1 Tax=Diabrotica balteata TaxID=107213 RepID=A0A9N9XCW4_DIABA|nr:unnamed protein product [Diabrotica balteata]
MTEKTEDSVYKNDIPHSYDGINWKLESIYNIRVGNIYDPSKFWIVHFTEELNLFYSYMNSFYNEKYEEYRMPVEYMKRNTYCAVYTDNGFYRALIVEITNTVRPDDRIIVFLLDFGYTSTVSPDNIYILYEKMFHMPRCAIRACLYGIEPYDSDTWTTQATEKFKELTQGKILMGQLCGIDDKYKTVYIRIVDIAHATEQMDVGETLIIKKMAKIARIKNMKCTEKHTEKFIPKVKYPYLCPSFDLLESGTMPSSVHVVELLKTYMMTEKLFQPYYTCGGIDQ